MVRGISLFLAAIFALGVISLPIKDSHAADLTATPTLALVSGTAESGNDSTVITPIPATVQPQPDELRPKYPYPTQILELTIADSGRSFVIPLYSAIWVHIPFMPNSYFNYNPAVLQPYLDTPVPLPYDSVVPEGTPMPIEPPQGRGDIYPYPFWQFIAVGTGTTNLSLAYTPCYSRVCPKYPVYNFSVTITVDNYAPPPYPTPIPPYPPDWPPSIGSADVYIGTAYLDQVVNVHVGQTVRIDLPFIAAQEALRIDFNGNILQALPGQQLDHPQRGGWLFRVVGAGSTMVTVNSQRCMSDSGSNCNSSLLFRVTLKSS